MELRIHLVPFTKLREAKYCEKWVWNDLETIALKPNAKHQSAQ